MISQHRAMTLKPSEEAEISVKFSLQRFRFFTYKQRLTYFFSCQNGNIIIATDRLRVQCLMELPVERITGV